MGAPDLVLWHCRNARSFRALWALEELGLPYQLKLMAFPPRVFHRAYLEVNPLGTIPYLEDGAEGLTESSAIPHYLAMRHGGGRFTIAPDAVGYGDYLNWLHHGEATLTFPQTLYLRYAILEPEERRQLGVAEDYKRWFLSRLRKLTARVSEHPYAVGDSFTMADISVGYAVMLAEEIGIGPDLPPPVRAYFAALKRRPAFIAAERAQDTAPELVRDPQ